MSLIENKLFQFETMKSECASRYLLYLCEDIINMINILRKKKMFYLLTPHNQKIVHEVEEYYRNYKCLL